MGKELLFRLKINNAELYLNLYGSLSIAYDEIVRFCCNTGLELKIIMNSYLCCTDNKEVHNMSFVISDVTKGEVGSIVITYCNNKLFGIIYNSNNMNTIESNLTIFDTDSNIELISNRLNVLCMVIDDSDVENDKKVYVGKYNGLNESLCISKTLSGFEYEYILEDGTMFDDYEYARSSTNIFYKQDNSNKFDFKLKGTDETIEISADELKKLLGEYNE